MAVTVTGANNNSQANSNRVCVRTAAGIPYVIVWNTSGNDIEIYKGNSATPSSFTEQDTADNPSAAVYGAVSAAIDSTGIIHIVYMRYITKSDDLIYVTYNTTTDQWGTPATINSDLGAESTSLANLYTSIAIDSNDIPHVAYVGVEANAGTVGKVIRYENRIGGAWIGTGVEVEGQTSNKDCINPSITIDENNIPCISYLNDDDDDLARAVGNANDASSFTLVDLDASALSGSDTSICVDSAGVLYVAGVDSDGTIMVYNETTQRDTGVAGSSPTLVANGTDIYVFYEDANNDIAYNKTTDGGVNWLGSTVLEAGTFNTPISKWANLVNFGSGGAETQTVNMSAGNGISIAGSGQDPEFVAQGFKFSKNVKVKSITARLMKSNSPTDNLNITIRDAKDGTVLGTATIACTSLTTSPVNYPLNFDQTISLTANTQYWIQLARSGAGDGSNVPQTLFETGNPYADGSMWKKVGGSWSEFATFDMSFSLYGVANITELDYTFADETASPDIWWNTLALAAASSIKTINGLAKASVKVVNGLAIASVKTWNGLQ